MDIFTHHCAQLFLDWFNGRFGRVFTLQVGDGGPAASTEVDGEAAAMDGDYSLLLLVQRLYETAVPGWDERRQALEERLSSMLRGAFALWVPPRAPLLAPEPEESDFVRRVQLAAVSLPSGARAEVHLPARLRLARSQGEGAYVSVMGGLSRYWTAISDRARGVFYLDSNAVYRVTADEERRRALFDRIGEWCGRLNVGEGAELDGEDSWTVQRLPAALDSFQRTAVLGCPPSFDPTDGTHIRRLLRKSLAAANERFRQIERNTLRAVALVSIWEYTDEEGVTATLRGMDSALFSDIDVIVVLADGGLRMALSPRILPWKDSWGT